MARRVGRLLGALACAVAAGSCAPPDPPQEEGRVNVVATIGMIRDVVENVGGQHVRVVGLMGPGVDPHLYKASEGDVRRLFRADVIFYGGLHLEARMGEVLEEMGGRTAVAAVTTGIPVDQLLSPPEFEGAHDPHVWFDVRLWAYTVDVVAQTLAKRDPAHASDYFANAQRYQAQLRELDQYVRAQAALVPQEKRVLITAHDAFNYFGRAYGFQVRGLQGISTAAEAGTADVQELAEFIATRRIPAVFVESSIPRRTIEAVQEAVRARGFDVQIGGSLYSDAMGNPGTPAGTYQGMVRHNIDTIVRALLREP
ncbi:metal ABC transporter solute-binding protein, Zn/Mn family [Longimicrobium sp.]|uniref:metal ABC transporter solute-binding protein, Zn/Mn family n=1 Tax=Longimicrobium sp. TaxID=2029185 RepID=UPI003B3A0E73